MTPLARRTALEVCQRLRKLAAVSTTIGADTIKKARLPGKDNRRHPLKKG
jgi:hypothetical protein